MTCIRAKLFTLVFVLLAACTSQGASDNRVEPLFADDALILREALVQLYPSLDRYGQKEDVLSALDRLDRIASTTQEPMAFYRAVVDVAVSSKDEHVIPFPPEAYRASRRSGRIMLPYTLHWVDREPYVASIYGKNLEHLIGRRIVAFDDRSVREVRATLRATIPSDGMSRTFALRRLQDFTPTQNENYFDLNYPIWFGTKEQYSLSVENEKGGIERFSLDALDWIDFSSFYRQRLPRISPIEFRWLDEQTAYLSINSFHDWYFDEHELNATSRLQEVFVAISQRRDARLILDLRRNEGGGDISSQLLNYLLNRPFKEYDRILTSFVGTPEAAQYCENANDVAFDPSWSEPTKDSLFQLKDAFGDLIMGANERAPLPSSFKGQLVVLISGTTGSAAAKVATVLDREKRAIFVGEETGGAAAGATAFGYCTLILPISGIKVDIPLVRFERAHPSPYGSGVIPDVTVDAGRIPPISDYDEALDAALNSLEDEADEE